MDGPLDGIRILDLTILQNGALATSLLGDMGADVIKIEDPAKGDGSRNPKEPKDHGGLSAFYEVMNRNKRAMTLNLKHRRGREIFYQMVKKADVVTQNFRVGVAERLGVDYKTLVQHNPRIITASATGFGRAGPDAEVGVVDIVGQARAGLVALLSRGAGQRFYAGPWGLADCLGAMNLAYAVCLALVARERHGFGQDVEVSQLGSAMLFQALSLGTFLVHGEGIPSQRETGGSPLYNMYECADGKGIAFGGGGQFDRDWPYFSRALGVEYLLEHPDLKRSPTGRPIFSAAMMESVQQAFRARPRDEWLAIFHKGGVYCGPVNEYEDLLQDPQILANEYIAEFQHPAGRPVKYIGIPSKLSRTPGRIRRAAPRFGEHTEEVLLQESFSREEIQELRAQGVV